MWQDTHTHAHEVNARARSLARSTRRIRARALPIAVFRRVSAAHSAALITRARDPATHAGMFACINISSGRCQLRARTQASTQVRVLGWRSRISPHTHMQRCCWPGHNRTVRSFVRLLVSRPVLELDISRGHDGDGGAHVMVKWPPTSSTFSPLYLAISVRYVSVCVCEPCDRVKLDHKSLHDANTLAIGCYISRSLLNPGSSSSRSHSFNEKLRGDFTTPQQSAVAVHSSAVC